MKNSKRKRLVKSMIITAVIKTITDATTTMSIIFMIKIMTAVVLLQIMIKWISYE